MPNYIDFKEKIDDGKLQKIAQVIKDGGVAVFPTETVYGIGVNGTNENAIKKLYKIKNRPYDKPISLLVNSFDMINKVAKDISDTEYKLMKAFFPGPLTIILNKKAIVPNILTANTNTVGIRMPENEIALKLIKYANVPIATSSSNISGKPSRTNVQDIMRDFEDEVDIYIDEGKSKIGLASTVVQIIDNKLHILRKGAVSEEQIAKIL